MTKKTKQTKKTKKVAASAHREIVIDGQARLRATAEFIQGPR